MEQISVGIVNFDQPKTSFQRSFSCLNKIINQPLNLLNAQFMGNRMIVIEGDGACPHRVPAAHFRTGYAPTSPGSKG